MTPSCQTVPAQPYKDRKPRWKLPSFQSKLVQEVSCFYFIVKIVTACRHHCLLYVRFPGINIANEFLNPSKTTPVYLSYANMSGYSDFSWGYFTAKQIPS